MYFAKPYTFMNRSGVIMPAILKRTKVEPEKMVVVCDNLDLPPGVCKLKKKGSSAGHNGIKSIIYHLGDVPFYILFIGIGRPRAGEDLIPHVLGVPSEEDNKLLREARGKAAEAILELSSENYSQVMGKLNRRREKA